MSDQKKADALMERGSAARFSDPQGARTAFAGAADIYRGLKLEAELANALSRQARIERDSKDYDRAFELQIEALSILRFGHDKKALAHALRHTADILSEAGRNSDADHYCHEMLDIYHSLTDVTPLDMANAVRSAAEIKRLSGNTDEARRLWREARERYAALDAEFLALTGKNDNPGVREADKRLALLGN